MQRAHRLTDARDFARVMRRGRRGRSGPVLVSVLATGEERPARVGVAAGRAIGSAVRRNRAKRLLREAFRSQLPSLPAGTDIVAVFKAPPIGKSFQDVVVAIRSAMTEAGVAC